MRAHRICYYQLNDTFMPRKIFRRWLPSAGAVRKNHSLRFLGTLLHDPNLFHLNRHSVSVAFFVGVFIAFIPIPGQVFLAAFAAFFLRCNLPLSIILVWISNPLTIPFIFFGTYKLGAAILGNPASEMTFSLSWEWMRYHLHSIWQPLLLGSVLSSILFGSLAYVVIQILWRWSTVSRWKHRRKLRLSRQLSGTP